MKTSLKILTGLLLLSAIPSQGQLARLLASNALNGDKQFESYAFADALGYYRRAYKNDTASHELEWKIAECYRLLNNSKKAEEWYAKIVHEENVIPTAKFYYAEALKSNGKYSEAKRWFEEYDHDVDDHRIQKKIDAIENQHVLISDASFYDVSSVSFNIEAADFAPTYYKDGVVFVSARRKALLQNEYAWDNSVFLDLYYTEAISHHEFGEVKSFDSKINSKLHDGPISFYLNGSKAVFTRNNIIKGRQNRSSEDTNHLQLYFAERGENGWNHITPFEYNNDEYSLGHATLSGDGFTMVFVSDMPGGEGKSDLYITRYETGSWTKPENLGDVINTKGDELFPFYKDSVLYFASSGHGGLGGLDVFAIDFRNPEEIINLGAPINSSLDDFGFIIRGREGYFSSNRDGNDNIYHFVDNRPTLMTVNGLVENDSDGTPIPIAMVDINDSIQLVTDDQGRFSVKLPLNSNYLFEASKLDFELVKSENKYINRSFNETVVLKLKPAGLFAKVIAVDKETRVTLSEPLIKLKNLTTGEVIEPLLIEKEATLFPLDKNSTYEIMGAKREYFTGHINESTTNQKGEIDWEVPLDRIVLDKEIKIENIYYDLDKAILRAEAKEELDKLVKVLIENPTIKIELGSHTDSRGSDSYNHDLSQRRAESAVNYIVEQGIESSRIVAKGYGETKPVNQCTNGVACETDMHQANRRTEFMVTEY
ncbi:WD40-like Beta Propeller Repeat [Ekhidna lutea]|uniref:WD40-like Beta Propeller Repeat n=1 Tax=Ekhidna lutea TaxID=447679 RepID=A0A239KR24_EKHLU|nr:OmpA family protein [Ekhidna lutea]SNT20847.1 WD40-like Beta Propeller Repeat [Ekhidna lutea]